MKALITLRIIRYTAVGALLYLILLTYFIINPLITSDGAVPVEIKGRLSFILDISLFVFIISIVAGLYFSSKTKVEAAVLYSIVGINLYGITLSGYFVYLYAYAEDFVLKRAYASHAVLYASACCLLWTGLIHYYLKSCEKDVRLREKLKL